MEGSILNYYFLYQLWYFSFRLHWWNCECASTTHLNYNTCTGTWYWNSWQIPNWLNLWSGCLLMSPYEAWPSLKAKVTGSVSSYFAKFPKHQMCWSAPTMKPCSERTFTGLLNMHSTKMNGSSSGCTIATSSSRIVWLVHTGCLLHRSQMVLLQRLWTISSTHGIIF